MQARAHAQFHESNFKLAFTPSYFHVEGFERYHYFFEMTDSIMLINWEITLFIFSPLKNAKKGLFASVSLARVLHGAVISV